MRPSRFSSWIAGCLALLFSFSSPAAAEDDERILRDAGLSNECPARPAFFHARARMDMDGEQLRRLLAQLAANSEAQQRQARSQLLGLGALTLPALRQAANYLGHPQAAARAASCLSWLEGPASHKLLIAAAHLLARHKPEGAAAVLLVYPPYADDPEVLAAVNTALAAVAAPAGKPDEVAEFGREGRLLLQLKTPNAIMASLLANGHILVACCEGSSRVYEMDRGGKVVWEYKETGNFIQTRRR